MRSPGLPLAAPRARRPRRALRAALALGATLAPLAVAPAHAGVRSPGFRAECLFTHRLPDDPIVRPGVPGASHSHDFFGNRSTEAGSTVRSLTRARTSCEPDADRAAYWVPTLYDTSGRPLSALSATFYYLASTRPARRVRPFPLGLKVIAGDPRVRRPPRHPVGTWGCLGRARRTAPSPVIRRCPRGSQLELELRFPDCWNGRDRDSPDHRRHMAYSAHARCPRSHPVPVPQLVYAIPYPTRGAPGMRISSGPSYTIHGDFFNVWDADALRRRVRSCVRRAVDCDPLALREG